MVLVITAVAVAVAIGIVRSIAAPAEEVGPLPSSVVASTSPVREGVLYVHVSGAVSAAGLYRLDHGARVVDAVAAAGGFADDADRDAVNLARPVSDGEQLHVAREGESPPPGSAAPGETVGGGASGGLVNLNTADATALDTLPRIGPALAARIIAWRDANGRFTSVEDLLAVSGIGEKMLDALRDLVTV